MLNDLRSGWSSTPDLGYEDSVCHDDLLVLSRIVHERKTSSKS
jgi:hypothetical protein